MDCYKGLNLVPESLWLPVSQCDLFCSFSYGDVILHVWWNKKSLKNAITILFIIFSHKNYASNKSLFINCSPTCIFLEKQKTKMEKFGDWPTYLKGEGWHGSESQASCAGKYHLQPRQLCSIRIRLGPAGWPDQLAQARHWCIFNQAALTLPLPCSLWGFGN